VLLTEAICVENDLHQVKVDELFYEIEASLLIILGFSPEINDGKSTFTTTRDELKRSIDHWAQF
jgi:hypothetical protein